MRNSLKHYPHLVLSQAISGKEGRKAERREAALAPKTTTLSGQRALFDEHAIAYCGPGAASLITKGAFVPPNGDWAYEYMHIQMMWLGWLGALKAQGIEVRA